MKTKLANTVSFCNEQFQCLNNEHIISFVPEEYSWLAYVLCTLEQRCSFFWREKLSVGHRRCRCGVPMVPKSPHSHYIPWEKPPTHPVCNQAHGSTGPNWRELPSVLLYIRYSSISESWQRTVLYLKGSFVWWDHQVWLKVKKLKGCSWRGAEGAHQHPDPGLQMEQAGRLLSPSATTVRDGIE